MACAPSRYFDCILTCLLQVLTAAQRVESGARCAPEALAFVGPCSCSLSVADAEHVPQIFTFLASVGCEYRWLGSVMPEPTPLLPPPPCLAAPSEAKPRRCKGVSRLLWVLRQLPQTLLDDVDVHNVLCAVRPEVLPFSKLLHEPLATDVQQRGVAAGAACVAAPWLNALSQLGGSDRLWDAP